MPKYRIKAKHELYCDYIVEAFNEEEAIKHLCRTEEPWTTYNGGFACPDWSVLAGRKIEVDLKDVWVSDATAKKHYYQSWPDWEIEEEEDSDE